MIYLLLGTDDFSKKEFLQQLQDKEKLEVCSFFEPAELSSFNQTVNDSNLFGSKRLVKAYDFLNKGIADQSLVEKIAGTTNVVVFIEEKLDKRKSETKKLLTDKNIKVIEFNIPVGIEFKNWVQGRIKQNDLKLSGKAMDLFLNKLGFSTGGFGEPMYSLWQVDSEIKKLKVFAGDNQVTEEDVKSLISDNIEENVFKITNAIGDRNKTVAIKELTDYMDRLVGDDKTKVISLSGILAEQFRNILIIQSLNKQGLNEKEMAATSGFAPGKLFVYKKLAANFPETKILDALKKLELLDQEVKTSNGPATLQMLMIIESLLK